MTVIDTPSAADFFCGGGGASQGLVAAGVDLKFAANHDATAIATHAHRYPNVDHHQVDLLEYDVAKMPRVQLAQFSPSCVHHSQANAQKTYEKPATLLDHINGTGPEPEARSGYASSERSRVTMSCVLRYADVHHPDMMIVENVVEASKWGPGRDGSTFRWWLTAIENMGYSTRPMFLNSAAFGVPQMRDRMYVVCWDKRMRTPDLDHQRSAWCESCDRMVESRQVFRHRTKAWPMAQWGKLGKQYDYRCNTCHAVAKIPYTPASSVIDWTDLGIRIGDRERPLAASTLGRIQRYLDANHGQLPAVTMTRSADYGTLAWPTSGPIGTMTTRHDQALISVDTVHAALGASNGGWDGSRYQPLDSPSPTALAASRPMLISHQGCVVPFRKHTLATDLNEPTFTQTAQQYPGLALVEPTGAMFAKNNGAAHDTAYHPTSDAFNTITAHDTTSLASGEAGARIDINSIRFRMMLTGELQKIMAFENDWKAVSGIEGKSVTKRDIIRLLGDAVTPPVADYLTQQVLEIAA